MDEKLYNEISIIWKTDEIKRVKPSPLDEAKWGLAVIEDSLWDTIPKVHKRLNDIFRKKWEKIYQEILILLSLDLGWG